MQTKKCLILKNLLKKGYNTKMTETKSKIPSNSGLATCAELTVVENEMPDFGNFVKKKQIMKKKILDIEFKYFNTADYDKFRSQTLDAKIN